jgi:hypothetical protein
MARGAADIAQTYRRLDPSVVAAGTPATAELGVAAIQARTLRVEKISTRCQRPSFSMP